MERYVKIVEGKYYDSVSNKIIVTNKSLKGRLPKKIYTFIPLFSDEFLNNNLYKSRQQLILSVTDQCNLRCYYCIYCDTKFQKNNTKKLKKMDFNIAKRAIDEFLKNSTHSERRCISFYGGEALLNFDLVKKCVEYVKSMKLTSEITFLITTNGTLLDNDIASFLYENRFLVNISMDGPEPVHDRYRRNVSNCETFGQVIKGVKNLIALNPDYWKKSLSFLCVLAPPLNMKSLIEYFELTPYNYTLSDLEMTETMKNILKQRHEQLIVEEMPEEVDFSNMKRARNGIETETRITKEVLLRSSISPFAPGRYCIPVLKRTFVSVDGNYYICEKDDQNDKHLIGNVYSGINYDALTKLRNEVLKFHNKHCNTCWAARFCGMCFATIDKFPNCCEEFKKNTLQTLKLILEENNYERL